MSQNVLFTATSLLSIAYRHGFCLMSGRTQIPSEFNPSTRRETAKKLQKSALAREIYFKSPGGFFSDALFPPERDTLLVIPITRMFYLKSYTLLISLCVLMKFIDRLLDPPPRTITEALDGYLSQPRFPAYRP